MKLLSFGRNLILEGRFTVPDSLSVTQAAQMLNVSRQRVQQLISSGALTAEKIGNVWAVNAASVEERQAHGTKTGRPSTKNAPDKQRYTLMNAEYEVLDFTYDRANCHFSASHVIHDAAHAPIGVVSGGGRYASAAALYEWWRHRTIPAEREGIDSKLIELGFETPESIPFSSLGLSLSDQYWIRPEAARELKWEDINFFDNVFDDSGDSWLEHVGSERSPDNTSEGQLPKKWVCRGNSRLLLKGGGGDEQIPYNECIATALQKRLLNESDFVSYHIEAHHGIPVSVCENFLTRREEYIPAWHLRPRVKKADGRHALNAYLDTCESLGIKNAERALSEMLVCDYLIANTDRHWRNFGLIRNIDTLEYRMAPLFDNGNSLWHTSPLSSLQAGNFWFESKPFNKNSIRQLLMTPDTDWLDIGSLDGFAEETKDVLSSDETLAPRAPFIARGIAHNIEQVRVRLL